MSMIYSPRRFVLIVGLAMFLLTALTWAETPQSTVTFVQLSDTHWGFSNPKVNPDFAGTLKKAIGQINGLSGPFDFVVFTGDETHGTADTAVRIQRMTEFKEQISALRIPTVKFLPGEHDSSFDAAEQYRKFFGDPYYTFDVKGVRFVALDNVSSGDGTLGEPQMTWLAAVLKTFDPSSPLVVFAHRPLLDVYAKWDWKTEDAARALELLKPFRKVTLFYGHIHQIRLDSQKNFTQYAAQGMMFPLPAPGSVDKPNPVAWDPDHPYRGLGFRTVSVNAQTGDVTVKDWPLAEKDE